MTIEFDEFGPQMLNYFRLLFIYQRQSVGWTLATDFGWRVCISSTKFLTPSPQPMTYWMAITITVVLPFGWQIWGKFWTACRWAQADKMLPFLALAFPPKRGHVPAFGLSSRSGAIPSFIIRPIARCTNVLASLWFSALFFFQIFFCKCILKSLPREIFKCF